LKKQFLPFILIICLVLLATACSTPSETSTTTTTTTTTSTSAESFTEMLIREGYSNPEIPRITCEDLKQQMDSPGDFIIIDTRAEPVFNMGHLAGAINILYNNATPEALEIMNQQLATLPDGKLKIFYCDCSLDQTSAGMAKRLIDKGYKIENIKVLWKGYFRWQELGYPVTTQ
jgi:rhodanese-related sulfurtransferase